MCSYTNLNNLEYIDEFLCNSYSLCSVAEKIIPLGDTIEEKKQLLIFFQAITDVDKNYLLYYQDVLDSSSGKECTIEDFLLERTFAYELYRKWQNLLEKFHISDVHVDAEIGKKITNNSINLNKIKELKGEYKEPDLVLHANQGNTEKHTIICEIKRNIQLDKGKISNDILKICHYLDPKIWGGKPYKYGCFIVVNKEFENLKKQIVESKESIIKQIEENGLQPNLSNILCITYNGDLVEWETLSKLFS